MAIQRRKKACKRCGRERFLYGHGLCSYCYRAERWRKNPRGTIRTEPKKEERIRQRKYKKARKEYLANHQCCEIKLSGCTIPTIDHGPEGLTIHHKKGRVGALLWDPRYFVACCVNCHRYLEDHPEEAKKYGWSLSRHAKSEDPPEEPSS